MSSLANGGVYYDDWRAWQAEDMQSTSMYASADRFYSYYIQNVLLKKMKELFRK